MTATAIEKLRKAFPFAEINYTSHPRHSDIAAMCLYFTKRQIGLCLQASHI